MKSATFFCIISSTFFAPVVLGHGYVAQMVIGGKVYKGPSPYGSAKLSSPIRKTTSTNPITNVESSDMTCGINAATTAETVAPATAGSTITFTWRQGSGSHWGHSIGPMITYMAKCPPSGCPGWNPKSGDFFKISQTGRKPNSMTWYMADIKAGKDYSTTIPEHIPNGDYIVRHEMIALHFATSPDAAQLFPSCSQVRITGGSNVSSLSKVTNGVPAHFPGAYKATDPGIYTPKIYTSKSYTFPGPDVATFSAPKSSRSFDTLHGLNVTHIRNQTLPHHGNDTSPTNNTAATPTATRALPVNPLKVGGTVVVDIVRPAIASNVQIPTPDPKRRDECGTSTSASETQPAPTQKHSHPHRPINARRAQHRRVIMGDSPQPHPKADFE